MEKNTTVIQKFWYKYTNLQKVVMNLSLNFELNNTGTLREGTFNEEPYFIFPETV